MNNLFILHVSRISVYIMSHLIRKSPTFVSLVSTSSCYSSCTRKLNEGVHYSDHLDE